MRILVSGWRTLILTLRRSASTIDDTRCASDIISSNSASINALSASGNEARCTDSSVWRPLTAFRSVNMRSEMNGAIGAASMATVSRQVYSVWYAASLSRVRPPPQKRLRFRRTYQFDRFSETKSCIMRAAGVGS